MKKIAKKLGVIALAAVAMSSTMLLGGCDFSVNYKGTSNKLNEVIKLIDEKEYFSTGSVIISGTTVNFTQVPKVSSAFVGNENYAEINNYYNTIFDYCTNYIKTNAAILATPPTVESLTEKQENLYKTLDDEISSFKEIVVSFEKEISNVNKYFDNAESYGESSEEVFVLNYKKAYRNFIYEAFDLANAIENVMDSVYLEIDYIEDSTKTSKVYKSLEKGINIRIFEGYFSFIVDSFDCRVPKANKDANEYMYEILDTYDNAKSQMLSFYKQVTRTNLPAVLTDDEIATIQKSIDMYFEETMLYQNAYDKLGFVSFYFDNDCALDRYINNDYANKNYYEKINDYINYTLPNLTNYVSSTFSA